MSCQMIPCAGECRRQLPPSMFHRDGANLRSACRDCRSRRPVGLVREYERLAADYRARRIRLDDPAFEAVRKRLRETVLARGPIEADGVRLGWDHVRDEVSRAAVAKGGRR